MRAIGPRQRPRPWRRTSRRIGPECGRGATGLGAAPDRPAVREIVFQASSAKAYLTLIPIPPKTAGNQTGASRPQNAGGGWRVRERRRPGGRAAAPRCCLGATPAETPRTSPGLSRARPAEVVGEDTSASELARLAKPVAKNLYEFLQQFIRGEIDDKCIT